MMLQRFHAPSAQRAPHINSISAMTATEYLQQNTYNPVHPITKALSKLPPALSGKVVKAILITRSSQG